MRLNWSISWWWKTMISNLSILRWKWRRRGRMLVMLMLMLMLLILMLMLMLRLSWLSWLNLRTRLYWISMMIDNIWTSVSWALWRWGIPLRRCIVNFINAIPLLLLLEIRGLSLLKVGRWCLNFFRKSLNFKRL